MFWVFPAVRTASGSLPRATSGERLLGKDWQRFSWHLSAGGWKPGCSSTARFPQMYAKPFLRMD